MTAKPMPVCVHWIDSAYLAPGWHDVTDVPTFKPCKCMSVGFLIRKTKKRIVLALSVTEGQVGGLLIIPRCAVQSITRFK